MQSSKNTKKLTSEEAKKITTTLIPFDDLVKLSETPNLTLDLLYTYTAEIYRKKLVNAIELKSKTTQEEKKAEVSETIDIRYIDGVEKYNTISKALGLTELDFHVLQSDETKISKLVNNVISTHDAKLKVDAGTKLSEEGEKQLKDTLTSALALRGKLHPLQEVKTTSEEKKTKNLSDKFESLLKTTELETNININRKTEAAIQKIVNESISLISLLKENSSEEELQASLKRYVENQLKILEVQLILQDYGYAPIEVSEEEEYEIIKLANTCARIKEENQEIDLDEDALEAANTYFRSEHARLGSEIKPAPTEKDMDSETSTSSAKPDLDPREIVFRELLKDCGFDDADIGRNLHFAKVHPEMREHYLLFADILTNKYKEQIERKDKAAIEEFKQVITQIFIPLFSIKQDAAIIPISHLIERSPSAESQDQILSNFLKNKDKSDPIAKAILVAFIETVRDPIQLVDAYKEQLNNKSVATINAKAKALTEEGEQAFDAAIEASKAKERERKVAIDLIISKLSTTPLLVGQRETDFKNIEVTSNTITPKIDSIRRKIDQLKSKLSQTPDVESYMEEINQIEQKTDRSDEEHKQLHSKKGVMDGDVGEMRILRAKEGALIIEFSRSQSALKELQKNKDGIITRIQQEAKDRIALCQTTVESAIQEIIGASVKEHKHEDIAERVAKEAEHSAAVLHSDITAYITITCSFVTSQTDEILGKKESDVFASINPDIFKRYTESTGSLEAICLGMLEVNKKLDTTEQELDALIKRVNEQSSKKKETTAHDGGQREQKIEGITPQSSTPSSGSITRIDSTSSITTAPPSFAFSSTSTVVDVFENLASELEGFGPDFASVSPVIIPTTPQSPVKAKTTPASPAAPATPVTPDKEKKEQKDKEKTTTTIVKDIYNVNLNLLDTHELANIAKQLANELLNYKNLAMKKAGEKLDSQLIAEAKKLKQPDKDKKEQKTTSGGGLLSYMFGGKPKASPKPEAKEIDENAIATFLLKIGLLESKPTEYLSELRKILDNIELLDETFNKKKITANGLLDFDTRQGSEAASLIDKSGSVTKAQLNAIQTLSREAKQGIADDTVNILIPYIKNPAARFNILSYFLTQCCAITDEIRYLRTDEKNSDIKYKELISKLSVNRGKMRNFLEKGYEMYIEDSEEAAARIAKGDESDQSKKDILDTFAKPVTQNFGDSIETYIEFFEGLYNATHDASEAEAKATSRFTVFTEQLKQIRENIKKDKENIGDHDGDLLRLIRQLSANVQDLGIRLEPNRDNGNIQIVYRHNIEKIRMMSMNAAKSYLRDFDTISKDENLTPAIIKERKDFIRKFINNLLSLNLTKPSGEVEKTNCDRFFKLVPEFYNTIKLWTQVRKIATPPTTASSPYGKFDLASTQARIEEIGQQADATRRKLAGQSGDARIRMFETISTPIGRETKVVAVTADKGKSYQFHFKIIPTGSASLTIDGRTTLGMVRSEISKHLPVNQQEIVIDGKLVWKNIPDDALFIDLYKKRSGKSHIDDTVTLYVRSSNATDGLQPAHNASADELEFFNNFAPFRFQTIGKHGRY